MNTVKYRALAKDGTWRYGSYPCLNIDMGNTKYPMDIFWNNFLSAFRRETLGQWTGLFDKQGKEIYEGDIVQEQTIMIGHTGKVFRQSGGEWTVSYRRGSHPLYFPDGYEDSMQTHSLQDWASDLRIVVIGNIHENPLKENE